MEPWIKHAIEIFPKARALSKHPDNQIDPNAIEPLSVDDLRVPVPPWLRTLIEQGDDPDNPIGSNDQRYPSRSEAVFAALTGLARLGLAVEKIAGVVLNQSFGISERFYEREDPKRQALKEASRAIIAISDDWPDTTKIGSPKPTFHNAYSGLIKLGVNVRYDEFKNRMTVGSVPLQSYIGELSDKAVVIIRKVFLDTHGFDPFSQHLRDGLETLALENTVHPIKAYLDSLVWDQTPRIRSFFSSYMGAEDAELTQAISFLMFVAAVRRVYQPGCKFDTMVVLEGKQGTGKSTALKILAGEEYFSDQDIIAADSKTQMELLEGVWIYEICELSGMRHTDIGKIKSFLSRQEDRGRPAYGRYKEVIKRQSIFVGTTNDETYLKDKTGNRRFLPVATGEIDLEAIECDRDQLWAEACYWEQKDASIILPEELWAAAAREQENRVYQDPWEDLLIDVDGTRVGGEDRIFTTTLLEHLETPKSQQQHYQTTRLAECMRKLGWNGPQKLRIKKQALNGYWRKTDEKRKDDAPPY